MIESAARNRDRFHGELTVVGLRRPEYSRDQLAQLNRDLELAQTKNAELLELDGDDWMEALLKLAQARGITQIYVGQRGRDTWKERAFGNDVDRLIRSAEGMDVRVFPHA
jgi:K+-sensing histidine kinase KdpD